MRHGGIGYDTSDTFSEAGTSDDDSCHIGASSKFSRFVRYELQSVFVRPFATRFLFLCSHFDDDFSYRYSRNARRKSVAPPGFRMKDDGIDYSPQNSVTSINSIASLLKEKLMVSSHIKNKMAQILSLIHI